MSKNSKQKTLPTNINNDKGISSIIATSILILITVATLVSFQTWFLSYQTKIFANAQKETYKDCTVTIEGITKNNEIYLKSNCEQKLKYIELTTQNGDQLCEFQAINDEDLVLDLDFEGTTEQKKLTDKSNNENNADITSAGSDISYGQTNGPTGDYANFHEGKYFQVLDDSSLEDIDTITVEAWTKIESPPASDSDAYIIDKAINLYSLVISANNFYEFRITFPDSASSINEYIPNTWVHVIGVYNGTNNILYINGLYNNTHTHTGSISTNSNNVIMGANLNGSLDNIKIYRRVLNNSEINQSYKNPNMNLLSGINILNIERGNCNIHKGEVINVFGYTNNKKFEEKEIIR